MSVTSKMMFRSSGVLEVGTPDGQPRWCLCAYAVPLKKKKNYSDFNIEITPNQTVNYPKFDVKHVKIDSNKIENFHYAV